MHLTSIFFNTSRLLLGSELFAFFGFAPAEIKYITVFIFNMEEHMVLLALKSLYLEYAMETRYFLY